MKEKFLRPINPMHRKFWLSVVDRFPGKELVSLGAFDNCKTCKRTYTHRRIGKRQYFLRLHCAAAPSCRTSPCGRISRKSAGPLLRCFCPRRSDSALQIASLAGMKEKHAAWTRTRWSAEGYLRHCQHLRNISSCQTENSPRLRAPQTSQIRIAFSDPVDSCSRLPQSVQKMREPIAAMLMFIFENHTAEENFFPTRLQAR